MHVYICIYTHDMSNCVMILIPAYFWGRASPFAGFEPSALGLFLNIFTGNSQAFAKICGLGLSKVVSDFPNGTLTTEESLAISVWPLDFFREWWVWNPSQDELPAAVEAPSGYPISRTLLTRWSPRSRMPTRRRTNPGIIVVGDEKGSVKCGGM